MWTGGGDQHERSGRVDQEITDHVEQRRLRPVQILEYKHGRRRCAHAGDELGPSVMEPTARGSRVVLVVSVQTKGKAKRRRGLKSIADLAELCVGRNLEMLAKDVGERDVASAGSVWLTTS